MAVALGKGVGLADDLDDLGLELLLGDEEALPGLIANLAFGEEGSEGRLLVAHGPDELDVVDGATEEGGSEDGARRGFGEGEERDVEVAGLVGREPGRGRGRVCRGSACQRESQPGGGGGRGETGKGN